MNAVNHMNIPTCCADQYGNIQAADVLAQTVERITAAELEDM